MDTQPDPAPSACPAPRLPLSQPHAGDPTHGPSGLNGHRGRTRRRRRSSRASLLRALASVIGLLLIGGCVSRHPAPSAYHIAADAAGEPTRAPAPVPRMDIAFDGLIGAPPPAPSSRPGLATRAGSRVVSSVTTVAFFRKGSVPDAIDTFHYNDEIGAKAMIDLAGGGRRRTGMFPAANQLLRVGLESRSTGRVLPRYETDGRRVVVGQAGAGYVIVLENRSSQRQEVVVSVDGLDVMTGRTAGLSGRGYVIEPRATLRIRGFREDSTGVREFRFGSVADSAAAARGQAANVGVIGLAVFTEDEAAALEARRQEQARRDRANAFGG